MLVGADCNIECNRKGMVNITGTEIHMNRILQEFKGKATVPRFCNIGFPKVNSKKIDAKHSDTKNYTSSFF